MTLGITLILLVVLSAVIIGAAIEDSRRFTISNRWVLAVLLLFIPYAVLAWGSLHIVWNLVHFAIALGVGMSLFALKWFGGGDVKLYAALALWFPLQEGARLLASVGCAGFLVVLFYVLFLRFRSADGQRSSIRTRRIPYGVAIAMGGLLAIATGPVQLALGGNGPAESIKRSPLDGTILAKPIGFDPAARRPAPQHN